MDDNFVAEVVNDALLVLAMGKGCLTETASWIEAGEGTICTLSKGPCHSGLGNSANCPEVVINFLQTNYRQSHGPGGWEATTHAEKVMFLDWLMNESPYKDAFYWKDAEQALTMGFCVMDGNCPGNVMGGGVVATRRLWEHTLVLSAWCSLVSGGMDKHIAYPIAHVMIGRTDKEGKFTWNGAGCGHVTIDAHVFGYEAMNKFRNHDYNKTMQFKKSCNYRSYSDMFGTAGRNEETIGGLNKYMPKGGVVNNPFANGAVQYSASYDKAIEDMLSIIPIINKKCGIE